MEVNTAADGESVIVMAKDMLRQCCTQILLMNSKTNSGSTIRANIIMYGKPIKLNSN